MQAAKQKTLIWLRGDTPPENDTQVPLVFKQPGLEGERSS